MSFDPRFDISPIASGTAGLALENNNSGGLRWTQPRNRISRENAVKAISKWNFRSTLPSTNNWTSIEYAPELGLFVALNPGSDPSGDSIAVSNDGINFTKRIGVPNTGSQSIAWSPELGIFTTVSRYNGVLNGSIVSSDGLNWTSYTGLNNGLSGSTNWQKVIWVSELSMFVAVTRSLHSQGAMTSVDGINWIGRTTPTTDQWWVDVCWSPELHLLVATAIVGTGSRIMTSSDGITWTLGSIPTNSNSWRQTTWSSELRMFVSVSDNGTTGTAVMTSSDGITWTSRSVPAQSGWFTIDWAPELGLFVALGSGTTGSTSNAMYSFDGITWVLVTTPTSTNQIWYDAIWVADRGIFVGVASNTSTSKSITSTRIKSFYGNENGGMQLGLSPIGSIIAWAGGYYTNGANAGFTSVLGNTVASVNTYLSGTGWAVCDGTAPNDTGSPIWNTSSRFLPNLTDSRFLMGSTVSGSIGGQNSITIASGNLPTHTHDMAHTHGAFTSGGMSANTTHTHGITDPGHTHTPASPASTFITNTGGAGIIAGGGAFGQVSTTNNYGTNISINASASIDHTHSTTVSAYAGSTGNGGFANTAIENRPLYLSTFYITRIK